MCPQVLPISFEIAYSITGREVAAHIRNAPLHMNSFSASCPELLARFSTHITSEFIRKRITSFNIPWFTNNQDVMFANVVKYNTLPLNSFCILNFNNNSHTTDSSIFIYLFHITTISSISSKLSFLINIS